MSSSQRVVPAPKSFLSLAPTVSDSYPKQQVKTAATTTTTTTSVADSTASTTPVHRRASSVSSTGSASQYKGLRFLKLGPVHFGEHPGEDKTDFHEVEVAVDE